jgi:hypothetical protein
MVPREWLCEAVTAPCPAPLRRAESFLSIAQPNLTIYKAALAFPPRIVKNFTS